ncbi:hypothetical protein [Nocardia sp. IFM 10818]
MKFEDKDGAADLEIIKREKYLRVAAWVNPNNPIVVDLLPDDVERAVEIMRAWLAEQER